jgi:hypothetical protein
MIFCHETCVIALSVSASEGCVTCFEANVCVPRLALLNESKNYSFDGRVLAASITYNNFIAFAMLPLIFSFLNKKACNVALWRQVIIVKAARGNQWTQLTGGLCFSEQNTFRTFWGVCFPITSIVNVSSLIISSTSGLIDSGFPSYTCPAPVVRSSIHCVPPMFNRIMP